MSATDELRTLLDERGVGSYTHEAPAAVCLAFFDGKRWHDCWESTGGEVNVTFSMTPEQVVAATLGAQDLRAENAKLRELVRAAWRCIHTGASCSDCRLIAGGCTLQTAMRELGIEVTA